MNHQIRKYVCLFLALVLISSVCMTAVSASYKRGSSGEMVKKIQTKLKEWGYYDGSVDGVFGSGTEKRSSIFRRRMD